MPAKLTFPRIFLTLVVITQVSACGAGSGLQQSGAAMDRLMHINHDHPMDHFSMVWRFVEYGESEPALEYVGGPENDEAQNETIPRRSAGPMPVDCSRYSDFGVLVKRTRLYHQANMHKIDFRVVDAAGNAVELKYYVRQRRAGRHKLRNINGKMTTGRYIKGLARFIGPHENGVYRVQVTHLDEILGEAEFELSNCEQRT